MNRAMLQRILTVAVLAPYLYKQSAKETGYFAIGLKMLAGGLIITNIPALMDDYKVIAQQAKNIANNLVKAQETLNAQNAARTVINQDDVTEADFTEPSV